MSAENMQSLLGAERLLSRDQALKAQQLWRRLKSEDAPFRIVTGSGLASAPIDHFDAQIGEQTSTDWRNVSAVIGNTMRHSCEPYYQVGDAMLLKRLIALIDAGQLEADGDPHEMRGCRVRRIGGNPL